MSERSRLRTSQVRHLSSLHANTLDSPALSSQQPTMPKPTPTEPLPPLLAAQTSLRELGGSEGGGLRPGSRASEPGQKLQDMETIVMVKQYALDAVKKAVARFMDPKVQARLFIPHSFPLLSPVLISLPPLCCS